AADEQLDFAVSDPKTAAMLLDAMKATPAKRARLEGGVTAALLPAIRERGVVVVQHGAPAKDEILKSIVKSGVPLAISADGSPWTTLQDLTANSQEGLTREQAIEALTRGGAYAENAENEIVP